MAHMMKKLLYITVNAKPEKQSASKTVGRYFVNEWKHNFPDTEIEELDLYEIALPRPTGNLFAGQSQLLSEEEIEKCTPAEKKMWHEINRLTEQFIRADIYVVATPMWSLSFPAPLKDYLDCVIQDQKTIRVQKKKKPLPLLNDKKRTFVYIQSSSGEINAVVSYFINYGLKYVKATMKGVGIYDFHKILVDGTGTTLQEQQAAIQKGKESVQNFMKKIR